MEVMVNFDSNLGILIKFIAIFWWYLHGKLSSQLESQDYACGSCLREERFLKQSLYAKRYPLGQRGIPPQRAASLLST